MPTNPNVIAGALKLLSLPDLACFTSFGELLQALPDYLGIEIPNTITNVVISNIEPNDSQRSFLWVRYNAAGGFIGFYLYTGGAWTQVFPAPNEIILMYGDSRSIPPGYQLADSSNPHITVPMETALQTLWVLDPTTTYYIQFHVTFEGF